MNKKLIEVALPLDAINEASAREKSIRHGHPSTLHLWWARRPLAAARAVIFTSLIDDPDQENVPPKLLELIDQLPLESKYTPENKASIGEVRRQKLFGFIDKLVQWENSNNPTIINTAQELIRAATNGNPPPLLDPFAGGGAIPLEAQRLGLEAHASDLNPVAVMINKAMIEIPPKFAGQPPVNPEAKRKTGYTGEWKGAQGLAEDVRYYGEWMKKKAFEKIGHLYPKVMDEERKEHTVIAWIWARTVKCPNPACGCEMPLASSFELSKKKGKEAYVQPVVEGRNIRYEVKQGKGAPESPKTTRGAKFKCIRCGESTTPNYIKAEAVADRMGAVLMAIVAEGNNGRMYISPNEEHIAAARMEKPKEYPTQELTNDPRNIWCPIYGLDTFDKLFTNRQLTALTTFCELVEEMQKKIMNDRENKEYAQAIGVYLAFIIDKMADYHSSLCSWHTSCEKMRNTFGRQAIPMIWDYTEANPFCTSTGSYNNMLDWIVKAILHFPAVNNGVSIQNDAQTDNGLRNIMVSTDPPYYDNIGYAVLSDFFYVWLRLTLKVSYPELFNTMLVPKTEELIASQYRFNGNMENARNFFESGMLRTFEQVNTYACDDFPVTVYYAYKQSEADGNNTSSTGWETMLSAIIKSGFTVTGTWPMRTELANRMISMDTNALASSIVLVCRKRPPTAPICTRRDFLNALKRELKPALQKLQAANIAPVDLAQASIGPGIAVYSRYSKVLEADGSSMSVRTALQIINQELDSYLSEQDGVLDSDTRFCVALYSQCAFNDIKFGEADVLARAKGTAVDRLVARGVLSSQKGVVRLLERKEIPEQVNSEIIWLLTQQLTHVMAKSDGGIVGVAKIVAGIITSAPEQARALAYRLFTIADRKKWADEAGAYNNLVVQWPEVLAKVTELHASKSGAKQTELFDIKGEN